MDDAGCYSEIEEALENIGCMDNNNTSIIIMKTILPCIRAPGFSNSPEIALLRLGVAAALRAKIAKIWEPVYLT